MENKWLTFWMIFLFLLLIGFLIWGIFYVNELRFKILIFAIVGVLITAFTSVFIVVINNLASKQREYDFHVLKEKQKVFEHFYNAYFEALRGVKKPHKTLDKKVEQEIMDFKKGLMNWGSETIIKKYIMFESDIFEEKNNLKINNDCNNFIKELRKELGFNDSKKINIMSIILTEESRKALEKN